MVVPSCCFRPILLGCTWKRHSGGKRRRRPWGRSHSEVDRRDYPGRGRRQLKGGDLEGKRRYRGGQHKGRGDLESLDTTRVI